MNYVKLVASSHDDASSLSCRSADSLFYEAPRFVTHIDDPAIAALTKYYSRVLPPSESPGVSILDMCSSWVISFFSSSN